MTYINHNHIHHTCFITIVKENLGNYVKIDTLWCWKCPKFRLSHKKSDFIQTTFDLKVWIQTFAENSDQSGRPGFLDGSFNILKMKIRGKYWIYSCELCVNCIFSKNCRFWEGAPRPLKSVHFQPKKFRFRCNVYRKPPH